MEVAVRKKLRRIFTIMGTTALIFTITACGNRMDAMQPDSSYVADFFDIPDSVTGIERLLLKDDMAYMCCLEEDGTSYLAAMNIDDGKFLKQNLELDASVSLLDFGFAPDNSIWAVCLEQAGVYSLRKFDNSGSLVQSVDLAGVMDTSVISAVGRDLFLSIDREGNICVAAKGRNTLVYLFDNNGSFLFSLDYEGNLMTTTTTAGGQIGICATSPDRMNYDLLTVDMKSRDWSKDKIYLGATAGLYGGVNKDFYRFDSSVLYGYAAGAQEGSPVFNWSDMGLGTSEVHLGECTDGRFVVLAASSNQTEVLSYEMAVLTKGADEREILSMVSLSATPGLVQAVSDLSWGMGKSGLAARGLQGPIKAGIRPEHIVPAAPDDPHAVRMKISILENTGREAAVFLTGADIPDMTMVTGADFSGRAGQEVYIRLKPEKILLY